MLTPVSASPRIRFVRAPASPKGVLAVLCDEDLKFGPAAADLRKPVQELIARAAKGEGFQGKKGKFIELVAPAGLAVQRLLVAGVGSPRELKPTDWLKLGGQVMAKVPPRARDVTVILDLPGMTPKADAIAEFALGVKLRAYRFERYRTRRKEDEEKPAARVEFVLAVADPAAAQRAWKEREAVGEGVLIARELVNEPPNVLFPPEFARRAATLKRLGVKVEVLGEKAMKRLGMGALIGVGQGSPHESQLVVMRWDGGKRGAAPLAVIGKGVCFDTGGISIKPAANMEDMKGDMAGAACVVGLLHALAARKAKANVVGVIGLVENMPSGEAQRPGDIVKSMSGQTIEIINTDAEGRLVLADALWYAKEKFKPRCMIDLATLTGAILISLGQEYAGMFSNDDKLAANLIKAGEETGERVWRMPLGPEYDKMIDSKFADMKNVGGRHGGSITAAQFLQRFVDKTPWAHLDIAGTGMGAQPSDINQSWGPGWGVRLLDRLIAEHYE
jgi:leucyl aminopeptidase